MALIQHLYAAPGSTEGWNAFLLALCNDLDATAASFLSHNVVERHADILQTVKIDSLAVREYFSYWDKSDPWVYSPKLPRKTGSIVVDAELIDRNDLRRTAYYNDFAKRFDITRCLAGLMEVDERVFSTLSVNASDSRAPFDVEDTSLLSALMPHLQRALQLHRRIVGAEALAHASIEGLDRLNRGILVVDRRGLVTMANRVADRILAARDGLAIENGMLRASNAADTASLQAAIGGAVSTARGDGLHAGGVLALGRPSGHPALQVVIAPMIEAPSPLDRESAAAILFVTDPRQMTATDEETIRMAFGLTLAEARLARALADGLTIGQSAARLGITGGTARTRLKTIFEKTNTHRQIDLVRLVLSSTAL